MWPHRLAELTVEYWSWDGAVIIIEVPASYAVYYSWLWLPYQVSWPSIASSVLWKVHTLCLPRCQIVIIILSYHAWIFYANNDSTSIQLQTLFCSHQLGSFLPCPMHFQCLLCLWKGRVKFAPSSKVNVHYIQISEKWLVYWRINLVTYTLLHFFYTHFMKLWFKNIISFIIAKMVK